MNTRLNVLVVEDSEDDTLLLLRELRRGGYDPVYARVDTPEGMRNQLDSREWEIVFSDFTMPRFNAFEALAMVRESSLDIPFIIVSGTIGEDRAVQAMKAGAHDYILKGSLKRLVPAVERELREARVRQEQRDAEELIRHLAFVDSVTGLPNRVHFRDLAQQAIDAISDSNPLALLLMDLERFKEVNDTLGHGRGDLLLQQVGTRLQAVLFEPDVVARLGGDEFGILLPRLAERQDVLLVVDKLSGALESPFMIDGVPIAVEASIGVAILPDHGVDADSLLQRADIAMYRAKELASSYSMYSPEYDPHSLERLGLMAELREAMEKDQLLLHYQPKVEIGTGRIVGTEALVRWQHPRLGLLAPNRFVESAERTGLITPLTKWVLLDALRCCRRAKDQGIVEGISVNLSARSLHDPRLVEYVWEALSVTDVDPDQLTLEITESAIMLEPKRAEESLMALHRMGVSLSIDDFGTGYTSLASIKRLPIHEIKIDRSFVTNMLIDEGEATIVRSIIDLGHNLGLRVVAEGIESQDIMDALAELGCDEAQGYFISRPQPYDEFRRWAGQVRATVAEPQTRR
jgi:diguanylate cyclase (GGDEF)-like protein